MSGAVSRDVSFANEVRANTAAITVSGAQRGALGSHAPAHAAVAAHSVGWLAPGFITCAPHRAAASRREPRGQRARDTLSLHITPHIHVRYRARALIPAHWSVWSRMFWSATRLVYHASFSGSGRAARVFFVVVLVLR